MEASTTAETKADWDENEEEPQKCTKSFRFAEGIFAVITFAIHIEKTFSSIFVRTFVVVEYIVELFLNVVRYAICGLRRHSSKKFARAFGARFANAIPGAVFAVAV